MPVLDESMLPEPCAGGELTVLSPLAPGVLAEPVDDWSGLLGAAEVVAPVGLVESRWGSPTASRVPGRSRTSRHPGLIAADEPVSGLAVWASAANEDTSAPAAKNGTSLLLMVIDVSPVVVTGSVRVAARARHDPLV